jgi:hypothetical protein
MMFQEFVPGPVGATSVLFVRGKPACWFSYFLRRNWPTPYAAASAIELWWDPQIEPLLTDIGQMTQFDGLCGIDWVLDEKGSLFLLEMNPRPTPGIYASAIAGVSFSDAIADWLAGKQAVRRPLQQSGRLYRMFPQNLFRAIDDREPGEFFRTFADAPWSDPNLMLAHMRRVFTHNLPPSWRTKLRYLFRAGRQSRRGRMFLADVSFERPRRPAFQSLDQAPSGRCRRNISIAC